MHLTRQQRRLLYLVVAFFLMSLNFGKFIVSISPEASAYLIPIVLFLLSLVGYYFKQEDLPWQLPLYYGLLKVIPLLPLERICRNNLGFFTLALLIVFSFMFLFIFKRDSIRELFGGEITRKVSQVSLVKNWFQASLAFVLIYILWAFVRGPMVRHSLPYFSLELIISGFLWSIYVSTAVFTIPIAFLRGKLDKEELLLGLALGFGLFERYFMIGSFIGTLLFLGLGWFFARASYETRGGLLTTIMLFVYFLGYMI